MADRLYLSYWLRGYTEANQLRHYERLLRTFPFSQLSRALTVLRVHAVADSEPPLLERGYEEPVVVDDILEAAREFTAADCAWQLDARWDLFALDEEARLSPHRCTLIGYGPEYERDEGEHLRVEFGLESVFLPDPERRETLPLVRANIQSLLTLVHRCDDALAMERRRLWTDSGDNFAERLQLTLGELD